MSYQRKIRDKHPASRQPVVDFDPKNLISWLEGQAKTHKLQYLLAHADDGVIWGRVDKKGHLQTSYDALHAAKAREKWDGPRIAAARQSLPPLRIETLQQARLFGKKGELYIWKDGDGAWNGRLIANVKDKETADWTDYFDEPQLLWGTHGTPLAHKFTLLEDGAQGLRHAVPLRLKLDEDPKTFGETRPPRLLVRHYLTDQGFAQVAASRLVALEED